MFFQGAVKGIGGADGKDRVRKINRFAPKEGSLTEVRWDAELCPGCELEWLPPRVGAIHEGLYQMLRFCEFREGC
jgi:hypothetical protein